MDLTLDDEKEKEEPSLTQSTVAAEASQADLDLSQGADLLSQESQAQSQAGLDVNMD